MYNYFNLVFLLPTKKNVLSIIFINLCCISLDGLLLFAFVSLASRLML